MVEPELLEAPLGLELRVGTSGEELRGDEDLLARNAARADARADRALVLVALRRVDVAVSGLERAGDDPLARAAGSTSHTPRPRRGSQTPGAISIERAPSPSTPDCADIRRPHPSSGVRRRIPPRQLWNTISNTISLLPQSGAAAMSSTKERACGRQATFVARRAGLLLARARARRRRLLARAVARRPGAADAPAPAPHDARPARRGSSPRSCSRRPWRRRSPGRLGDMYGRRRILLCDARRPLARHPRRRAHLVARGDDRSRGRSRDSAARSSRSPSGSSATSSTGARGARDGVDVGRARRRRRCSGSCWPARSSSTSPTTGCSGSRSSSTLTSGVGGVPGSCPSRPAAHRAASTGRPRCCSPAGSCACSLGVSEGPTWGWASARVVGAVRRRVRARGRVDRSRGARRACRSSTCGCCASRGVWTTNVVAVLRRLGHVQRVRARPAANRGAGQRRAASAHRSPRPGSTSCRGRSRRRDRELR